MTTHYIHRGLAKKNFKENTLSAFKYSFKKKYGIETDLQATKDNQLICFHDFNLRRRFNLKYTLIEKKNDTIKCKLTIIRLSGYSKKSQYSMRAVLLCYKGMT